MRFVLSLYEKYLRSSTFEQNFSYELLLPSIALLSRRKEIETLRISLQMYNFIGNDVIQQAFLLISVLTLMIAKTQHYYKSNPCISLVLDRIVGLFSDRSLISAAYSLKVQGQEKIMRKVHIN